MSDAADLQQEAAELLQSDQGTVSMDKLGDAMSIWSSVQEAIVKGTQLIGLDLDSVTVGETPITDSIVRLNQRLEVVGTALRQGGDRPIVFEGMNRSVTPAEDPAIRSHDDR